MKDKKIGFIGLGNVGSKIAYNILRKKNYSLYVFDLNKKKSNETIFLKNIEFILNENQTKAEQIIKKLKN